MEYVELLEKPTPPSGSDYDQSTLDADVEWGGLPFSNKVAISQSLVNSRRKVVGFGAVIGKMIATVPGNPRIYIGLATEEQRNRYPFDHKRWLRYTYVRADDLEGQYCKANLVYTIFKENPIALSPGQRVYIMIKHESSSPLICVQATTERDIYRKGKATYYNKDEKKWKDIFIDSERVYDIRFFTMTELGKCNIKILPDSDFYTGPFRPGDVNVIVANLHLKNIGDKSDTFHIKLCEFPDTPYERVLVDAFIDIPLEAGKDRRIPIRVYEVPDRPGDWPLGVKVWCDEEHEPIW